MNGVLMEVLFSGTNITWHDRQRRLINSAFSLSQLIKYEPWVEDTVNVFIAKLHEKFISEDSPAPIMNMMEWFAYFSLDVITDITFGERSGFLETGTDVGGTITQTRKMMEPWLYVSGNGLG
jgi:cytochrome P450